MRRCLALLWVIGCVDASVVVDDDAADCDGKCDTTVAAKRANLLAHLLAQMDQGSVLFGQQRYNVTGIDGQVSDVQRSDAKMITGHHPAVLGLDAFDVAFKPASWAPTPVLHAAAAKYVFAAGGVVTMSWHMGGCAVDTFDAKGNEACLCRLANDDAYARSWLVPRADELAAALVREGLDRIPIIFRPLHEQNGGWFWWGQPYWSCAGMPITGEDAYQRAFRTIITELRDVKRLDNLLVAYSPGGAADDAAYLAGYPGDAYVDVFGLDLYYQGDDLTSDTANFQRYLATINRLARAHGKAAALTEIGDTHIAAHPNWFTQQLAPLLDRSGVAYAMTWENRSDAYFISTSGAGADDFRAFEASAATTFLDGVPPLYARSGVRYPVCASCASDPDGDRWGWERGASCRVASWCVQPQYPACVSCSSDPDGDGWGWERERSCRIFATCH